MPQKRFGPKPGLPASDDIPAEDKDSPVTWPLRELVLQQAKQQSIRSMAAEIGVSQPALWAFAHRGRCKSETLDAIASHFGVRITKRRGKS